MKTAEFQADAMNRHAEKQRDRLVAQRIHDELNTYEEILMKPKRTGATNSNPAS